MFNSLSHLSSLEGKRSRKQISGSIPTSSSLHVFGQNTEPQIAPKAVGTLHGSQ